MRIIPFGTAPVRSAILPIALLAASSACAIPAEAWTYKTLFTFTGSKDGSDPNGGLLRDAATGNLYGVSEYGGDFKCDDPNDDGCGVLFELTADGTEAVLHAFHGGHDGRYPLGGLVKDNAGNLYGTTVWGGTSGLGTIFKLAPDGQYTVMHSFKGSITPDVPPGNAPA